MNEEGGWERKKTVSEGGGCVNFLWVGTRVGEGGRSHCQRKREREQQEGKRDEAAAVHSHVRGVGGGVMLRLLVLLLVLCVGRKARCRVPQQDIQNSRCSRVVLCPQCMAAAGKQAQGQSKMDRMSAHSQRRRGGAAHSAQSCAVAPVLLVDGGEFVV